MKVYLAGMESKSNLMMAKDLGARHLLVSAHALMKGKGTLELIEEMAGSGVEFFCDSGAFTFMARYNVYGQKSVERGRDISGEPDVAEHFQKLIEFYRQHGHLFEVLAEFDVGPHVIKTRMRKELEQVSGKRVLPTWDDPADPREYLRQLIEDEGHDYVGVGGFSGGTDNAAIQKAFGVVRGMGARAHAWGSTGDYMLRRFPLYSADSTSWMMGAQYGITYVWKHSKLQTIGKGGKEFRVRLKKVFEETPVEWGLDFDAFVDDKGAMVNRWNLLQWMKYTEWLEDVRWAKSGRYWEKPKSARELAEETGEVVCTCGSEETAGACLEHRVGRAGNAPPRPLELTEAHKEAISVGQMGNMNAVQHGRYSPRLPQVRCDDCYAAGRCPKYEEGKVCGFDPDFQSLGEQLETRDWEGLVQFLLAKLQLDASRFMRAYMFEILDGGTAQREPTVLSQHLSSDLGLLARLLGVLQPEGLRVDARRIQVVLQGLSSEQLPKVFESLRILREVAPETLEIGGKR